MSWIVVIGNLMSVVGPFDTEFEAKRWADMAGFTSLTDNGRISTAVVPLREPAKKWAFKVPVEVWGNDEADETFTETYAIAAVDFDEADSLAEAKARAAFPGRLVRASGAQVRL